MTLQSYYIIIKQKIQSQEFTIKVKSKDIKITKEECVKNAHLESITYLMFEFMLDRKDPRKKNVFDYVCIPHEVNKGNMNIDFSTWKVEDFLKEIMKIKD